MRWCQSCGERYQGTEHNCGWTRISNDELRHLKVRAAEADVMQRELAVLRPKASLEEKP